MREFFQEVVENLHIYCGARAQMRDWTDEEISKLLDVLEKVSKLYSYIPEEKQKEIIEAQLLKDKEYQNINARLISKWLEENGKSYYEQSHHKEREQPEGYKPVEGAEREKWLNIWNDTLKEIERNFVEPVKQTTGNRLREHFDSIAPIPKEESALDEFCKQQAEENKEKL